jgi:VanZ family protein
MTDRPGIPPAAPGRAWVLLGAYAGLLFLQSSLPAAPIVGNLPQGDKLLHFLAFTPLGWLSCRALGTVKALAGRSGRLPLAAFLLAAVFAASDEWHQAFVPGRFADGWDWLADAAGVATGIALHELRRHGRSAVSPIDNPRLNL